MSFFAEENDLGEVYFAPFDVVLSDNDTVQPDLLFVSKERLHIVAGDDVQGAPDLVMEIRSDSTAIGGIGRSSANSMPATASGSTGWWTRRPLLLLSCCWLMGS